MGDSVPVAEVLPGDVEREGLSGTDLDGLALEVPEYADGIVGATKADVELGNLVTNDLAVVCDVDGDSEENLVEASVATKAVGRTGRKTRLRAAVRAASGPSIVKSVLGVVSGSGEVGAVQARVDVSKDKLETLGAEVISRPVADGAVGGGTRGLASSRLVGRGVTSSDLQVAVRECGVRETVAELVDGCLVELVEVAVVNEDTLDEVVLGSTFTVVWLVDHVGRAVVTASLTPGERSLSTRVDLAVEDVGDSIARLLARNTSPDDGGHVLMLVPGLDQDSTDSVHDDNGVVALGSNGVNELITGIPQSEVVAVTLIAIEDDVSFTSGSVCENNARTADLRNTVSKGSLLGVGVVVNDALDGAAVAEDLGLDGLKGSHEVREVSCGQLATVKGGLGCRSKPTSAASPAHGESAVVAATVNTSVGSVRVLASILTKDSSKLLLAREREGAVVLEQDGSVGSNLADRFGVVVAHVDMVVDLGVGFLRICVLEAESVL